LAWVTALEASVPVDDVGEDLEAVDRGLGVLVADGLQHGPQIGVGLLVGVPRRLRGVHLGNRPRGRLVDLHGQAAQAGDGKAALDKSDDDDSAEGDQHPVENAHGRLPL
jgi:hypothetical protein